jgi:PAS domain S-box-containing protein
VHPDDKDRVVGGIHKIIDRGGKNWSGEYRFRRKDGSYAIVFDRGYALHDENGQPYRMLGSMQDITERKEAEEALRHSEARLQKAVSIGTVGVIYFDLDGIIHEANAAFERMSGYRNEDFRSGKVRWDEVTPPEFIDVTLKSREEFLTKWENTPYEKQYVRPDGSRWWGLFAGKRLSEKECVEFVVDITEAKQTEEELERKVKERTIELAQANDALLKGNRELVRLNKNLEEFAYAASHDLKEPVRKIHFYADRLKHQLGDSLTVEQSHLFSRVELATLRMGTLIDDLLTYSRISTGVDATESINLNEAVKSILEDLELEIEERDAIISIKDLPVAKGHKRQLQQLFGNLISNALKYSKEGVTPEVQISAKLVSGHDIPLHLNSEEGCKQYHLIEVKDNGIGFVQEDAERIFNVFTRLHGNAEYKGTGVGLSIARKVVENHNGYIWAESSPGMGATFKIVLPAE